MWLKMRYVVSKPNRGGSTRFYWQRPGFPTRRLSDDEAERTREALALNERADAEKRGAKPEPEYGSIAWAVEEYRRSRRFNKLAVSTRKRYEIWIDSLKRTVGDKHLSELTPKAVSEIIDAIESPGRKIHCKAVLAGIARVGLRHWILKHNPVVAVELESSRRRTEVWTPEQAEAFVRACAGATHGEAVALGFQIMRWTGQRPSDVRAMRWSDYDGQNIRIRQIKTGAFVEIACLEVLRRPLDAAKKTAKGLTIVARPDGRPMSEPVWLRAYRTIAAKAGVEHLQARDLRRTLASRLAAEAEATPVQLAGIFGWSLDHSLQVLEHYVPRNTAAGKIALLKLEPKNGK